MGKKIFLVLVIMFIFFVTGSAFAHINENGEISKQLPKNQDYNNFGEWMNKMHQYIINQIDDPKIEEYMDEMHENCMSSYRENSRGYMAGPNNNSNYNNMPRNKSYGMMNYGRMM